MESKNTNQQQKQPYQKGGQQQQQQPPPQTSKAQKMREKRKDMYQIDKDPFVKSLQSQTFPQYINIHKFMESRAYELKHFNNIMQNKFTTKLEHQLLPKHLRRRAMAHNYYRIPLRVRFKSLLELQPSEPEVLLRSKCRKHRRKIKYLLNLYERRQRKIKWTETHIWHAKRFKMIEKWGFKINYTSEDQDMEEEEKVNAQKSQEEQSYKIAYKCSDKSTRAIYRLSQYGSNLIIDQSYMRNLLIKSNSYRKVIEEFKLKDNSQYIQNRFLTDDNKLICPLQFIVTQSPKQILIIYHPLAELKLHSILSKMDLQFDELFLNNITIIGKDTILNKVYNVLQPLSNDGDTNKTFESIEKLDQNEIDERQIIYVNLSRQELDKSFKMNERIFKYEMSSQKDENKQKLIETELFPEKEKKGKNQSEINVIEKKEQPTNVVLQSKQEQISLEQLVKSNFYMNQLNQMTQFKRNLQSSQQKLTQSKVVLIGKKLKPLKWIGTQRGAFTHRKNNQRNKIKNLLTNLKKAKENHQKLKEEQDLKKQFKREMSLDKDTKMQDAPQEDNKIEEEDSDYVTVIIYKNKSTQHNGFGNSFTLLIPEGYGLNLFRRFVYSGCKAIGHKEFLSIKLETCEPVFPDDYLNTMIGYQNQYQDAMQNIEIYCKRPPSKRANYQKINNPYPFIPKIDFKIEHQFIQCWSFSRGVPKDNAIIYRPSKSEIERILSNKLVQLWEQPITSKIDNKNFNFEYSLLTNQSINLSKKEQQKLEQIQSNKSTYDYEQLNSDLTIKTLKPQTHEIVGFITRGGYSQIRGRGIGIGIIQTQYIKDIYDEQRQAMNDRDRKRFSNKLLLIIRNADSLRYIPVIVKAI